jgi:transposase
MEQQGMRTTFKYRLKPTPDQECMLERTLMLCCHVYNAAVGERREAWRMRGISVTYYQQKAELPGNRRQNYLASRKPCQSIAKSIARCCRMWCCG